MPPTQIPIFEALIVPYRSLTRKGVMMVVGALMVPSASLALRFFLVGAWPVVAFSLFDVPMVALLLLINLRRARASELIMLDERELKVIRTSPACRQEQVSLPSAWLRIDLDSGRGVPRIVLRTHGRDCEVGAFLHEPAKLSLFEGLRDALHRARNPRFDNPQLGEGDQLGEGG